MYGGGSQLEPGVPGSFPLPIKGSPGAAYTANSKVHPAAYQASPRTNPLNRGTAPLAGKK